MIKILKQTRTKSGNTLVFGVQLGWFVQFRDKDRVIGQPCYSSDKSTASKIYTQIKKVRGK